MDQYFAIDLKLQDLNQKIDEYYEQLWELGWTKQIQKSYFTFYGKAGQSASVSASGSQGQLKDIMVNDYRSIVQHVVTLVTANRPSFDVRCTNTDYKSVVQAKLGEQILEYYMRERAVEKLLKRQCDYAAKYSEGFLSLDWDVSLGRMIGADPDGRPISEGDIRYSLYHTLQVIRDLYNDGPQDWYITAQKVNKYELAAKFPANAEDILKLDNAVTKANMRDIDYLVRGGEAGDTDMVPFYTFYHRKSAALPEGRVCFFVETSKLLDGPLPYDEMPITRMAPKDFDGTCLGYSPMWDLLGLQEASDKLYSGLTSNNLTFCKQIVQTSSDNDINVSDLAEGVMLVESDAELKAVNLTRSAPETYQLLQLYQSKMQELSGINEVVRGVPGPNLRSGNALAIVAAQAITYNSDMTSSYTMAIEDCGTLTLRLLKQFAGSETPRYAAIVGKYNKAYLKEFTADSISNVDRVTVQQRNAVMSTTAGKIQLAENLLQNGILTNAEDYLMVVETGNLDTMTDPKVVESMLIRQENEAMADGKVPQAVFTDTHMEHILKHKSVLANIEAREDPAVVAAVTEHMGQHLDMMRNVDPELLMLTGNQPSQMNQGGAPQGGAAIQQPPESGAMPANGEQPLPTLPEEVDPVTAESYAQLEQMSQQS
jgi:hypothetical protein